MLIGHLDKAEPEFVAGWAANSSAPDDVQEVVLYIDGERWATIRCDQPRPDLQEAGQFGQGRHGFRYEFASPLQRELDVRISVRFASNGEMLRTGERVLPGERSADALTPILVTAPGRSGTTLLMNRLSKSPQIVVAEIQPFEVRLLAYYATAYHVLTAPADLARSTHPDSLEGSGFQVGFNPFSDGSYLPAFKESSRATELFRDFAAGEHLAAFRRIISEYYLRLRDDQGKATARFFAEKTNNLSQLAREFPRKAFARVKEIVLIRDPRDLYCSQVAYFHSERDAALRTVLAASNELLRISSQARDDVIFLRYQDLLSGEADKMRLLSRFLGVEIVPHAADDRERRIFAAHATSGSPEASVDRWQRELDAETLEIIEQSCRELLDRYSFNLAR